MPGATFRPGQGSVLVVLAACLDSVIVGLSSLSADMGPCGSILPVRVEVGHSQALLPGGQTVHALVVEVSYQQ